MSTTIAKSAIFGGGTVLPICGVTDNTTLHNEHYTVIVDATSGVKTITLPTAAGNPGRIFIIQKGDVSANAVTVTPTTPDTINGLANKSLAAQGNTILIQSDGITDWHILITI